MANNPYVNKVIYGNDTVMDISDTTAEEGDVVTGKTFYKASGARSTGSAVIPDISNCYQTTDTAETDIQDTDYFPFYDTSATAKRKTLWSNIKAKLKAYFDIIYATLASPTFTGTPTAPTAASGTNTTQIATTAFVQGEAEKKAIELTKAQYDALPSSEKQDPTKVYYVNDYDPSPVDFIDDNTTALNRVWSSSKTASVINSIIKRTKKTVTTSSTLSSGYYKVTVDITGVNVNNIIGIVLEEGTSPYQEIYFSNAYTDATGPKIQVSSKTPSATVVFSVISI